jgi:hypothetical protein
MKIPNLFLVGAPKCGTTSLHDYLRQHPQIFMPSRKEYFFFGSDLAMSHLRLDEYLSFFQDARDDQSVLGESSTWYLYSRAAAQEIKTFSPNARIIAMIRNPAAMLPSLHSQFVFAGHEDIPDFESAYRAESDRRNGKRLPLGLSIPRELLYYSTAPRYAEQLARYFQIFGRENVLVIVFDDFVNDTDGVYKNTLRFLGVDDQFQAMYDRHNPNKTAKSRALTRLLFSPPAFVRRFAQTILPASLRHTLWDALYRRNIKTSEREPIRREFYAELVDHFRSEVDQLSALLDRDLSSWNRIPER